MRWIEVHPHAVLYEANSWMVQGEVVAAAGFAVSERMREDVVERIEVVEVGSGDRSLRAAGEDGGGPWQKGSV